MQKRYFLAPGYTQIPPEVLLKMAEPIIQQNHVFEMVMEEVRKNPKYVFGAKNKVLIFVS